MSFRSEEGGIFRGVVQFLNIVLNAGSVKKEHVETAAGIEASKLEHQHRAAYCQESDTTSVAESRVIHVVKGTAGTLKSFKAGCVVACTGTTSKVTFDLHKNGVSILTATFDVTPSHAAYELVAGMIDTEAVVADDVLEVVVTVNAGDGAIGKGVFAYLDLHEDAD